LQGAGSISTGARFAMYEAIVSGEYIKENHGFELYNGLYSLFVGDPHGLQLVGRGGYESVVDPGNVSLRGIIWSAGIVARPLVNSYVRIEYGRRYDKPAWNAVLNAEISPKLTFSAAYTRSLEPLQARIFRSLAELTGVQPGQDPLSAPVFPELSLNLIGGLAFTDDFVASLTWRLRQKYGWYLQRERSNPFEGTILNVTGGMTRRRLISPAQTEETWNVQADISHQLGRRLNFDLAGQYYNSVHPFPGLQPNESYTAAASLIYQINRDLFGTIILTRKTTLYTGNKSDTEHAIQFRISQRF
jgi:hypothetical protein